MKRSILKVFMVLALVLGMAAPGLAYTVTEAGDAGELITTSQDTTGGSGALTTITGLLSSLGGANDADLYKIYIANPGSFTATTVTGPNPGAWTAPDTMLFLFDASGKGLMADDDIVFGVWAQSKLSTGTSLQPTVAGIYYLGVSTWNNLPLDSSNANIFPGDEAFASVGPAGDGLFMIPPVSSLALSSWNQNVYSAGQGDYTITLEGASAVPLPPSVLLIGTGILGLVGLGWRRRKVS